VNEHPLLVQGAKVRVALEPLDGRYRAARQTSGLGVRVSVPQRSRYAGTNRTRERRTRHSARPGFALVRGAVVLPFEQPHDRDATALALTLDQRPDRASSWSPKLKRLARIGSNARRPASHRTPVDDDDAGGLPPAQPEPDKPPSDRDAVGAKQNLL